MSDQQRCQGRTRAGRPCRALPVKGSDHCRQHGRSDDGDQVVIGDKVSQASELVEMAREDYRFAVATTGEPFAVAREGPYLARMLRGGSDSLRAELAAVYADRQGRAPSSAALADALLVLEGLAQREERWPLALRLARHENGVVVDLGDEAGRALVVRPGEWHLSDYSPTVFRRTEATGAWPAPESGGDLDKLLRPLLNVTDEAWPLLVAWLVAAFLPEIPHPILALTGEQGSAKSTATRRLVALTDPSPAPLRTVPRDVEQWVTAAAGSWVVALDNVSTIPAWLSDALCRAVTGDGFVKRRLYSDNALVVLSYRRVVILNGIDLGGLRGDLADRLLAVELERIRPEDRLDDADAQQAFEDAWPAAFGALLDLVSDVLGILPEIRVERPPRMADFARVVAAVDKLRGTTALDTYRALVTRVQADVVDADPVARAVRDLVDKRAEAWQGSAGELLTQITPERPPRGWPETPQGMAAALRRAAPPLRAAGVNVTYLGKGGGHAPSRGLDPREGPEPNVTNVTTSPRRPNPQVRRHGEW